MRLFQVLDVKEASRTGRVTKTCRTMNCQVWLANTQMYRPEHLHVLSPAEHDRIGRLSRTEDRVRSVLATVLAKIVAGVALDIDPCAVSIDRTCQDCGGPHGKPQIRGGVVQVSMSHSADLVAVAITKAGSVGVDVEHRSPQVPSTIAEVILGFGEELKSPEDLLIYWCRKESVVKATGQGLRIPLREVTVSAADQPPTLTGYPGRSIAAAMADIPLPLPHEYVGSVTILTDQPIYLCVYSAFALLRDWSRHGRRA